MSTILITGGAGMIGSNLVKALVKLGHRCIVIDNLCRGKLENLHEDGKSVIDTKDFYCLDLSYPIYNTIFEGVDYVYHLADIVAGIGYVFNNEGYVFRQNLLINSNVINAVRDTTLKGFIYVGTACSFPAHLQSGIDSKPLKEGDQYPASPESAYGWSKLMGEYETFLLGKETNIPVSVLSLHNVYGAPCDFNAETGQVIPSLIRKAVNYPKEKFIVWGSGKQGRSFIHVDDVVRALILAKDKGLGRGVIQIGTDECIPIKMIAFWISLISDKGMPIIFDKTKPEGDRGRRANCTKAKKILGWSPKVHLYDGLKQLYQWVSNNV